VPPTVESTNSERRISVLVGHNITLSFSVFNANPAVSTSQIMWYFNGTTALTSSNSLGGSSLMFLPNRRSLTIRTVNYNLQGRFSMDASNAAGSDSDYIDLVVEGKIIP